MKRVPCPASPALLPHTTTRGLLAVFHLAFTNLVRSYYSPTDSLLFTHQSAEGGPLFIEDGSSREGLEKR